MLRVYVILAAATAMPRAMGVALIAVAGVLAWRLGRREDAARDDDELSAYAWLASLPALAATTELPIPWTSSPASAAIVRGLPLLGLPLLAAHGIAKRARARTLVVACAVLVMLACHALTIVAVPSPRIDVWQLFQHASHTLLSGRDPYLVATPDVYAGRENYGYRVDYFPYPPLPLVLAAPAVLVFGDYRFGLSIAIAIAAVLFVLAGRRAGSSRTGELAALALVMHPRMTFVVGCGWSEPLLILGLALCAWLYARSPRGGSATAAIVALASMKQYVVVPAAFYILARPRWRAVAAGALVALLVAAPFVVADARALVRWGLRFNLAQTSVRYDSMTLSALVAPWVRWGPLPAFVTPLAIGVAARLRFPRKDLGAAMLASIAALAFGFLLAWQGFVNYYVALDGMALVAFTTAEVDASS